MRSCKTFPAYHYKPLGEIPVKRVGGRNVDGDKLVLWNLGVENGLNIHITAA